MAWLTDSAIQLAIVVGCLALLSATAIGALILIARSMRSLAREMRRLHLQQGNIVATLLRAGFRPARGGPDWFDERLGTRVSGDTENEYTDFDWRKPQ